MHVGGLLEPVLDEAGDQSSCEETPSGVARDGQSPHTKVTEELQAQNVLSWRLIGLRSDKQNGNLVEKLLLVKEEIAKICNEVVPHSARQDAWKIQLDKLDDWTHISYGLYGHKEAMLKLLGRLGVLPEAATAGNLPFCEPGIYALMRKDWENIECSAIFPTSCSNDAAPHGSQACKHRVLFLVLWPNVNSYSEIHSKNQTTTLLRHLTQLCGEVILCLDEECALSFPEERISQRMDRVHRYKIQKETTQEEMFELREGFTLNLKAMVGGPVVGVQMLPCSTGGGFLQPEVLPPTKRLRSYFESYSTPERASIALRKIGEKWQLQFNEDMSNEQRLFFLRYYADDGMARVSSLEEKERRLSVEKNEQINRALIEIEGDQTSFIVAVKMLFAVDLSKALSALLPELGAQLLPDLPESLLVSYKTAALALGIEEDTTSKLVDRAISKSYLCERVCLYIADIACSKHKSSSMVSAFLEKPLKVMGLPKEVLLRRAAGCLFRRGETSNEVILAAQAIMEKGVASFITTLAADESQVFVPVMLTHLGTELRRWAEKEWKCALDSGELSRFHRRRNVINRFERAYFLLWKTLQEAELFDMQRSMVSRCKKDVPCTLYIHSFRVPRRHRYDHHSWSVELQGKAEELEAAQMRYTVHQLVTAKGDCEQLERDPRHQFTPRVQETGYFNLPLAAEIVMSSIVKERVLVVSNRAGATSSGNPGALGSSADSTDRRATISVFNLRTGECMLEKRLGQAATLVTFDEHHRLLAVYRFAANCKEADSMRNEKGKGLEEVSSDCGWQGKSELTKSDVCIFRFDEEYRQLGQACSIIELCLFFGEAQLRDITFVPGSQTLSMLDTANRIRFYDVRQGCILSTNIELPSDCQPQRVLSTDRGLCLMVITAAKNEWAQVLPFMGPSFHPLEAVEFECPEPAHWLLLSLGKDQKQSHLTSFSGASGGLWSWQIFATSKEQSQVITSRNASLRTRGRDPQVHLTPLEYLFYVFDKFPVQGAVESSTNDPFSSTLLSVALDCSEDIMAANALACRVQNYVRAIHSLLADTRKPLMGLDLLQDLRVFSLRMQGRGGDETADVPGIAWQLKTRWDCVGFRPMPVPPQTFGKWIQTLICQVPVQIVRAEDNDFLVLVDGVLLPGELARSVAECIDSIQLGLHGALLDWWDGPVVVVSSMGKQSTGKSYTLNHLFGLSLEISGARCTDGCWMTTCLAGGVLYVVLDFEGLGSFERTEQEDMLLSVFNSALSNMTIFKTEYRLDKDLEQMFSRFQNGANLIKGDSRLFTGQFCIVVKDVASRDIESVEDEFHSKISHITASEIGQNDKSDNFISSMYNGEFTIFPFPTLGECAYYTELQAIVEEIGARPIQFRSGRMFSDCMKTLMAKMVLKDWRSLDRHEMEMRIRYLREHVDIAFRTGRASCGDDDAKEELTCLDTGAAIPDIPLEEFLPLDHPMKSHSTESSNMSDVELILPNLDASSECDQFNMDLCQRLAGVGYKRTGQNHAEWWANFGALLGGLVQRRCERVLRWVEDNLMRFKVVVQRETAGESADGLGLGENTTLDDEASVFLDAVRKRASQLEDQLELCKAQCANCYLKCLSLRGHLMEVHSCLGNHLCDFLCAYCGAEEDVPCTEKMGHRGSHDCRKKAHTCGEFCSLRDCLNCNLTCTKRAGHGTFSDDRGEPSGADIEHLCNAPVHLCGEPCSALDCSGKCQIGHNIVHTVHKCEETSCIRGCIMDGCRQRCCARDHFHCTSQSSVYHKEQGLEEEMPKEKKWANDHFCGQSHSCPMLCESPGICKVSIERMRTGVEEYEGKRGRFQYQAVSEANGEREGCRILIPPFQVQHEGNHCHTSDPFAVHFCDQRCPSCQYFCEKPIGHAGLHNAAHGMMRDCYFVSDTQDIDIEARKYVVGEFGHAELCDAFCRAVGRGHSHVLTCNAEDPSACTHAAKDGRRHAVVKYLPDDNIPKDEVTHECYWKTVGWEDPCSLKERKKFSKCNHTCGHQKHFENGSTPSFCTLPMWHAPADRNTACHGRISSDGHLFDCKHTSGADADQYHVVMVLDDSGSMKGQAWEDLVAAVHGFIASRLQVSNRDILSIIQHSDTARIVAEASAMASLRNISFGLRGRGNDFPLALRKTYEVLQRVRCRNPEKKPLVMFLSDGMCNKGRDEMKSIKDQFSVDGLLVYTIAFGTGAGRYSLEKLAKAGGGKCLRSIDGVALKKTFMQVASSMGCKISLVPSNLQASRKQGLSAEQASEV